MSSFKIILIKQEIQFKTKTDCYLNRSMKITIQFSLASNVISQIHSAIVPNAINFLQHP